MQRLVSFREGPVFFYFQYLENFLDVKAETLLRLVRFRQFPSNIFIDYLLINEVGASLVALS